MKLQVRAFGNEVHVEVDGVAGRQHDVLQALSECRRRAGVSPASPAGGVNIRASSDRMQIRLRGREGVQFEAEAIYRCLREALVGRGRVSVARAAAPVPQASGAVTA